MAVKPQLLHLFWVALALWALRDRRLGVLAGFGATLIALAAVATALDPSVWAQYAHATRTHPPTIWMTPTLGLLLRLAFGLKFTWLQFVPPLLSTIAMLAWWTRARFDWRRHGDLVVLASLATTAYGWTFDLCVAVPAVVAAIARLSRVQPPTRVLIGWLAINTARLVRDAVDRTDYPYAWTAPALLAGYLVIARSTPDEPGGA